MSAPYFRETDPPTLSRAQLPLNPSVRAIQVTPAANGSDLQMQPGPDGRGLVLNTTPMLRGDAADEIAQDPFLRLALPIAKGDPESKVSAFWNRLLGRIVHMDNIAYLIPQCHILHLNEAAGDPSMRVVGAYGPPLETEHGDLAIGDWGIAELRDLPSVSGLTSVSSRTKSRIGSSIVPDMALVAPLTVFSVDVSTSIPCTPILIVEFKPPGGEWLRNGACAGLAQMLSAALKASVHRICNYGLLSVGFTYTRVYIQAHQYVELDMTATGAEFLCRRDRPRTTIVAPPYIVSWDTFQLYANKADIVYPKVQQSDGLMTALNSAAIDSIRDLFTTAIIKAHETLVHRIDTQPASIEPMPGYVRLRIVKIYQNQSPDPPLAASSELDSPPNSVEAEHEEPRDGGGDEKADNKRPAEGDPSASLPPPSKRGKTSAASAYTPNHNSGRVRTYLGEGVEIDEDDNLLVPLISPQSTNARIIAHVLNRKIRRQPLRDRDHHRRA